MTRILKASLLAGAACLAAVPATAQSRTTVERFVENALRAYAVFALRLVVPFTYQTFETDILGGTTTFTGLTLRPEFPWDGDRACAITIDRAVLMATTEDAALGNVIETTGLGIPAACLDPAVRDSLAQFGYDGIASDAAVITFRYDLPSSAATFSVQANLAGAADLNLTADFAYLGIAGLVEDDPRPAIRLASAEVSIENRGLWQKVEPMIAGMVGATDALPEMLRSGLESELSAGGTRTLSGAETAFLASLAEAVGAFVKDGSRLTLRSAPEGGLWLDEALLESPDRLIAALAPVVSTGTHSAVAMLDPALVTAVTTTPDAPAADRLAVGRALMTGIGAPRDRTAARALLEPLAAEWNAEAAMLLAEGLAAAGDPAAAYPFALRAMAGGVPGAIGLGDRLEATLAARIVRDAQVATLFELTDDPGLTLRQAALIEAPDVHAMRRLALDLALGRGVPRNYETAYQWATLAAAAGDRSAANLRDDLDARAAGRGGAVWREAFDGAANLAYTIWSTDTAFAAKLAGRGAN